MVTSVFCPFTMAESPLVSVKKNSIDRMKTDKTGPGRILQTLSYTSGVSRSTR